MDAVDTAMEAWWTANKADMKVQLEAVVGDNKYKLLSTTKTNEEYEAALGARNIPYHIAQMAKGLY